MTTIRYITLHVSLLALLTMLATLPGILGQEATPRPEPGTAVVPAPIESPDAENMGGAEIDEKAAFVRIFNFASGNKDRLAVLLSKGPLDASSQESNFTPMLRGSRSPDTRDYSPFLEGDYELLVKKEDATDFSDLAKIGSPYSPGQELISPLKLKLKPRMHVSIFIWLANGKLQAAAVEDGATAVRLCNFVKLSSLDVLVGRSDNPTALATNPTLGISVLPKTPLGAGGAYFLKYRTPAGTPITSSVQVQSSSSQGVTLVVYYDKYGRVSFQGFPDAIAGSTQ